MCIAVYKPAGVGFPVKRVLKRCFYKNPDGAGFMVANGTEVEISKGYMGFRSFWKALREARERCGDDKAYVMHFRISTQGGIRQDGCHPFPLSKNMDDLRKLRSTADIGIAHNGIIDLFTDWSSYAYYYSKSYSAKKQLDYSDTMKFITEYLSLIIHDRDYYKDNDTLDLIEKLCGSRLAILDGSGHCELIGYGWECNEGVWYSNGTYKLPEVTVKNDTASTAIATTRHTTTISMTTIGNRGTRSAMAGTSRSGITKTPMTPTRTTLTRTDCTTSASPIVPLQLITMTLIAEIASNCANAGELTHTMQ